MNDIEKNVKKSDAKIARVKSKETELKQKLRSLNRELDAMAKVTKKFEELKKEVEANTTRKTDIENNIDNTKAALIKELGLG